ncbi:MAG: HAMP domain-containing histidine kinase, partial [Actinobacteria bacterium]|nr:HAMP domain-containing histidine kinase [Actinomycetota bacterium]
MRDRARPLHPARLRRRLAIAFALVAGLTAGALAVSSYLLVRETRLRDSVDAAVQQTRFNLELAREVPPEGGSEELLAAYERRGEFETAGRLGERDFSSSLSVARSHAPAELRRLVEGGQIAYQRTTIGQTPYVVTGGRAGRHAELYFFFSEEELTADLDQLRNILLAASVALAVVGGLIGMLLARRTLAPVARASAAARSIAEGLLETRLPVGTKDEFGAWAASFNEMADALQRKIGELSAAEARERRFTSDVAHELRTPLTALVAEASLLRDHLDRMPAEARRPAELLVADVGRLRRLVDDLMEISRLDAGALAVRDEPVDVGALVTASVRSRGWETQVRLEDGGVTVRTDPRRLERVVTNLVANGVEHGGGHVSVRIGRDGDVAVVEVTDSGPGIPPDQLPRLFERFYKVDSS